MKKEKLPKSKMILYISGLALSVLVFLILILIRFNLNLVEEQKETATYFIDFFIGLCSSVFVTILFAFLLDQISLRESNEKKKNKRNLYLNPIKINIAGLFFRACLPPDEFKGCTINDFSSILNRDFDEYCAVIEKISHGESRDCKLLSEAYNLKYGIEDYSINPLIKAIDEILGAYNILLSEGLLNQNELIQLHYFKDDIEKLRLPYLGTLSKDKNSAHDYIDWPKEPINDIVKANYKGFTKAFQASLIGICNTIPELKSILDIKVKNIESQKKETEDK